MSPRARYLLLTFIFVGLVAVLILLGQFTLPAAFLVAAMIYAPRIVHWVESRGRPAVDTNRDRSGGPWG